MVAKSEIAPTTPIGDFHHPQRTKGREGMSPPALGQGAVVYATGILRPETVPITLPMELCRWVQSHTPKSGNEPPPVQIRGLGAGYKSSFAAALGFFCSLFNWHPLSTFGVTGGYAGMTDRSREFLIRGTTAFGAICWLGCGGVFGQLLYRASPGALINHLNDFSLLLNMLQFWVLGDHTGCSLYTWVVLRLYGQAHNRNITMDNTVWFY